MRPAWLDIFLDINDRRRELPQPGDGGMTLFGGPDNPLRSPRGNPVYFEVRDDTSDLSVVGSSIAGVAGSGLVDEYRLRELHITGRFVDVGAHIGSVTVAVLVDNPEATAICVEPIPENVNVLRRNLELNDLSHRVQIIEGAVGVDSVFYDFSGTEHLVTNRYISNSTGYVFGQPWPSRELPVRRVHLVDLLPAEAMKLDCEGGEWGLFKERGITKVPFVFGEWHGDPGEAGIRKVFGKTHDVDVYGVGDIAGNFRAVRR